MAEHDAAPGDIGQRIARSRNDAPVPGTGHPQRRIPAGDDLIILKAHPQPFELGDGTVALVARRVRQHPDRAAPVAQGVQPRRSARDRRLADIEHPESIKHESVNLVGHGKQRRHLAGDSPARGNRQARADRLIPFEDRFRIPKCRAHDPSHRSATRPINALLTPIAIPVWAKNPPLSQNVHMLILKESHEVEKWHASMESHQRPCLENIIALNLKGILHLLRPAENFRKQFLQNV